MVTEITEEEAWPERFMTESQKDRFVPDEPVSKGSVPDEPAPKGKQKKSKKAKKGRLKLDTAEDVIASAEGPSPVNDDVAADASRGM